MSVGAIIVAAGSGERFGGAVPKQLSDLGGRSLLQRSVAAFDRHAAVGTLVVVLPPDLVDDGPTLVGATARPCRIVGGGPRRQDSVRHGVAALPPDVDLVLVHDAARPFADAALIDRVIDAVQKTGAAVPALQARDTVKRLRRGTAMVGETIPRDEVWLAQTPQGFRRAVIEEAVALGAGDGPATDEAMLAERLGHPVAVVAGSHRNVKITTQDDLAAARTTLLPAPRVGTGYDLHRLVDARPLVLAGVQVPFERGPSAHSDGDVVCHALIDAILGAAGAGDIGRHFPNTELQWKNAAGLDLLSRAVAIARAAGWRPASVDVTVVLERPPLGPHIEPIRERLAATLGVAVEEVGLKAKTNEGVDAVGRGEAIAAHAVAVLVSGTAP
jgi:2-C-methyl-D-erythritol 4-phosphate cytidylyltransferase/2-C-methyl-D-erythritol 2,4-cyclodiphosphate synthase